MDKLLLLVVLGVVWVAVVVFLVAFGAGRLMAGKKPGRLPRHTPQSPRRMTRRPLNLLTLVSLLLLVAVVRCGCGATSRWTG